MSGQNERSLYRLLILLEVVFLPDSCLRLVVLMSEVGFESGTEVDVPAPEPSEDRFGILVVVSAELAVLARVLCHNTDILMISRFSGPGHPDVRDPVEDERFR